MNGWLIIAGAMLICFADREAGSITFTSGTKIAWRYPLIGFVMIVCGVVINL
jgi:hypothetical protein